MYWAPFERTENTSFKSKYSTQDVYNTFRRMGYSYTAIRRQYRAFRKVYETYCAPYVTSWQDSGEYEGETVQYQGSGTKTLVQRNNGRTIVENDRLTLDEGYFQDLVVGRWKVGGAIYPELDDQLVAYFMPLYHARKYAQEVKDGYVRQDENGNYDYSNVEEHPTHVVTDPDSTMGNQRIGEHEGGEGYVPVAWRFSKTPLSDGNPQWEAPAEGKAYLDGVDAQDCWQQFDKVEDDGMYCAGDTQGYTVTQWLFNRKSYTTRYFLNSEELGSETGIWGRQLEKAGECQQLAATKPETAGLVFVGWFDDNGNQVTDLTIPIGGEDLYARFAHPDVQVVFEADGGAFASGASGTAEDPGATETSRDVPYGKSFNASSAAMPADPVREGYSFGGWWYFGDDGTGTPARFSFDYNLKNDVVLHAAWKANPSGETTYRVVHIAKRGAGRTVLQEETLNGHVGDSVTALALDASSPIREGLRFCDGLARTITLDSNAEGNVIEFVYEDPASNNFTVRYLDAATGLPVAAERSFDGERPLQDESAVAVEGYTVRNGGRGYLNAARAGGNVLTFLYDRNAAPEPDPVPTPDEPDGSGDSPSRTALHQAAGTPAHQPQHAAGPAHASAQLPKTGDHAGTAPTAMSFFGSLLALLGSSRKRGDHEKGRSRS